MNYAIDCVVWVRIPGPDGNVYQGVVYDYLPSRQRPYHVRRLDQPTTEAGAAYRAEELAPGHLTREQVTPVELPAEDCQQFSRMMGWIS